MIILALALAATSVPSGDTFTCTPTAVYDGDGPIWCREGHKIRLRGVAAREMDGTCRPGHPCPAAGPLQARDALVRFLGGPKGQLRTKHILVSARPMKCQSFGNARGERTAASCNLPGVGDLSCAMVRTGTVARWAKFGGNELCR